MNSPHVVAAQTAIRVTLENIGNLQDYNGYYNGKLLTITPQVTSGNNNLTMEAKDYSLGPAPANNPPGYQCYCHHDEMSIMMCPCEIYTIEGDHEDESSTDLWTLAALGHESSKVRSLPHWGDLKISPHAAVVAAHG
ncbi:hypothetical protein TIFTF001_009714 [Ficus carica]|uniref:Uncharacterized protein n=1 Tax=Ficus carica TaxID=3494 RepID=A0AA88AAW5_FICCA|nr:hypothetical protein TIFTF001_009714 [Ficus carica]